MDKVIIIDNFNKHTFAGKAYFSQTKLTIPGNGTVYTYGKTSRDRNIFMEDRSVTAYNTSQDINVSINLYEDPTVDLSGATEIPIFNNNRNRDNGTSFENYKVITVTDLGTQLPRGNVIIASRSEARSIMEKQPYMMKRGSGYLLEVKNNGVNPVNVILFWSWWEDGDQQ